MAIIKSLLDTDLYKLTMMQAVFHKHPSAVVKYEFKCRNKGIDFKPYLEFIKAEIEFFRMLTFQPEELSYLKSLGLFREDFINFLFTYRNNMNRVDAYIGQDGDLHINVEGTWLNTILAEVPILAIVNEIYFTNGKSKDDLDTLMREGMFRLVNKGDRIQQASVLNSQMKLMLMEFGTRRRFSHDWQGTVIKFLAENCRSSLIGTSNVYFAKKYNIPCKGTHAHEWFMAMQSLYRLVDSQKMGLQLWADEYRGELAIALGDTLGLDAFLRDFDKYFAKLYDGVRQDSGDPEQFHDKVVAHYQKMGLDPSTKSIVFSDGQDIDSALALLSKIGSKKVHMIPSFGIGTSLTNDLGVEPLQIVMKLTECNGFPVAKISEARGKTMCNDPVYLEYLKKVFNIE